MYTVKKVSDFPVHKLKLFPAMESLVTENCPKLKLFPARECLATDKQPGWGRKMANLFLHCANAGLLKGVRYIYGGLELIKKLIS
jgi:hypothetical protein